MNINMKFNKIKYILISFFIIYIASFQLSNAQVANSLFNMRSVPQSNYINPAITPDSKLYIGIPALSSIYFNIGHTGFTYNQAIQRRKDDTLVVRTDNIISKLDNINYLYNQFNAEIISFGWKRNKWFYGFSYSLKEDFYLGYPKDLLRFGLYGNTNRDKGTLGDNLELGSFKLNATAYQEFAFTVAREIDYNWQVGVRPKLLVGLANASIKKSLANLRTDSLTFDWIVDTDLEVNGSMPGMITDSSAEFEDVNWEKEAQKIQFKNLGFAIDLGAKYRIDDKFNVGVSLVDFGFIRWKRNVNNFKIKRTQLQFEGVDITDFFKIDDTTSLGDAFQHVADSLEDKFKPKHSRDAYTSYLVAKLYLYGSYDITKNDKVALLLRNDFFAGNLVPSATVIYNRRLTSILSLGVNYSIHKKSYFNVGAAMSLNIWAFQWYIAGDNLYALYKPNDAKNFNIHTGFNLTFGRMIKKKKSVPKSRPQFPMVPNPSDIRK